MLTLTQVLGMERALRGQRVLSVFVDTSGTDSGTRSKWRTELDRAFARVLADAWRSTDGERTALELCLAHVRTAVEAAHGAPGRPGWVAYATTDDVVLAGAVRSPLETTAFWRRGLVVAPLLPDSLAEKVAARLPAIAPAMRRAELQPLSP
jgi:hypothetical protein